MYVAVKGGHKAIGAAHRLLADKRRGPEGIPELTLAQIRGQLALSVSRVMAEGSLYAPDLAALAVKQAWGDLVEAVFLIRAARTSYPFFGYCEPLDTSSMRVARRVSGTWKDLPGGQILGPTFDYTHRILEPSLAGGAAGRAGEPGARPGPAGPEAAGGPWGSQASQAPEGPEGPRGRGNGSSGPGGFSAGAPPEGPGGFSVEAPPEGPGPSFTRFA
ncbi:MAG: carbon-phosphorus lyase complex subunit PhnI, partial [Deltaproteobacteria bacterium]|nr:carbon-phosphorus lyase complex subunit PhnI [Deltaproteobacteria bacterium]